MPDSFDAIKANVVALGPFYVQNATTNVSSTAMLVTADNSQIVAPGAGSVVGISVKASGNDTAGSATFTPAKNGTAFAQTGTPTATINSTNSNAAASNGRINALRFAAGDGLGVNYVTTADMSPTNTNDFEAWLFVALDPA